MSAEIVPLRLGLTKGDVYTLWAPLWRDAADEWEGFLGDDEDLYAFESVADLVAFVRTSTVNDLSDHPAWTALAAASAHALDPAEDRCHDLVGVPEVVAEKPTEESVESLVKTLVVVQALGSVCDLTAVSKFFNGNPVLSSLGGGVSAFDGRVGRKRWADIEAAVSRNWEAILDSIDELVTTPDVDAAASEKAEAELAEPAPEPEVTDDEEDSTDDVDAGSEDATVAADAADADEVDEVDEESAALAAHAEDRVLGSDEDFWHQVGIDPVRIMTGSGTFFTLRCYVDEVPKFLGRNGRISVFGSERALARYLADEHESDLSGFSTYDDIHTAATDGSLRIRVSEDNVYVLTGIADDIADGPDTVDVDQLALAVELMRDVGDYAEDGTVEEKLDVDEPLGRFVAYVLKSGKTSRPPAPYAKAVEQWESLQSFVESRLRTE
jgi:hypothetical protein